ncbi:MAG: hypothetical protein HC899_39870 [Leptolyngbyaceae cyanobacterium SM1_4_3]|nr:hypothetical protein [Leptolyngbyaceae cyanobacterium SM1_4_3]
MAGDRSTNRRKASLVSLSMPREQEAQSLEASAYRYLGLLYQAMGNRELAVKAFDQAITLATDLNLPLAEECQKLRSPHLPTSPPPPPPALQ